MPDRTNLLQRISRAVTILLVLATVITVGEAYRRYLNREADKAMRRALVQARHQARSPAEIEPEWDRLVSDLRSQIDAEPQGRLAQLAYRADAQITVELTREVRRRDGTPIRVTYGARPTGEIPLPEGPYFWSAEIEGSVDEGEWRVLDHGGWTRDTSTTREINLFEYLPQEMNDRPWHRLAIRVMLTLYVGDQAVAASRVTAQDGWSELQHLVRERRILSQLLFQIQEDVEEPSGS